MADSRVTVTGLTGLVKAVKGPLAKDLNRELRAFSKLIAADLKPLVEDAVRRSGAPQAHAMANTVRVHSDRVPVVVIGKVNPRFSTPFRGRGQSAAESKRRRGALAHGVVYGPKGGKKSTPAQENYYRIPRDESGGGLGLSLRSGPLWDEATAAYLRGFRSICRAHGFIGAGSQAVRWGGRDH